MSTKVKRSTIGSLMQENVDLIVRVSKIQMQNDKLRAEIELLIDLIKIEEV